MAFVTKQELLDLKKTNPTSFVYNYGGEWNGMHGRNVPARDITEEIADQILQSALQVTLNVRQAKLNRPWDIVNLTSKLDPKQPWLGFEFEMGFDRKADYDKLIHYIWTDTTHVAVDREGYGAYCPEVTFSPENLAAYMDGSSTIQRLIKWMNDNKTPLANFGEQYVGTHLNLSTPAYRKGTGAAQSRYAQLVNNSILTLTQAEHVELFGRKPFGLGTQQASWIEYKMFRSTDNLKAFNKYVEVSKNLAELMEYMMAHHKDMPSSEYKGSSRFIYNFADILRGKAKADAVDYRSVSDSSRLAGVATPYWRGRVGLTLPESRKAAVKLEPPAVKGAP